MFVHQSNSLGVLIDALAAQLRNPERRLFERPQVMIQSAGMERYLSRELALRHGVVLGIDFPYPRAFLEQLLDASLGPVPDASSYSRESLTFHNFRLLADVNDAEVRSYLRLDPGHAARLELAIELARLFDQYSIYRPRLLAEWLSSEKPSDFQCELWQKLARALGPYDTGARIEAFCALPDDRLREVIPRRIYVFGGAGLPPLFLRALSRLAQVSEVHLFSFTVCQEYFADAHSAGSALSEVGQGLHPLIVGLGRVGGDFQHFLEQLEYTEGAHQFIPPKKGTLLAALQEDILLGRPRPSAERLPRSAMLDGSLSVVSCHSPLREVEILHENLIELFERDPSLKAEEVVVLLPKIESYSPLIRAVFSGARDGEVLIPFRVADESERTANASVAALLRALSLFTHRFKVSEVLSVLQMDPVLARFEMTAQDLERVTEWLEGSGTRWGLDEGHLEALGFDEPLPTTWERGLSRLLLGFAMEDHGQIFRDLVPFDDVALGDADLLGRLCDFLGALREASEVLMRPCSVGAFVQVVRQLVRGILAGSTDDSLQTRALESALANIEEQARWASVTEEIAPLALLRLLEGELAHVRQSTEFLAGGVTFCELLPLRTIPFRVVCVLGLSEGEFPRNDPESSLDRLAERRARGDRLLRSDDRYLFLELLMSTQERLILSYVGRSVQDNSARPPSVVLSELEQAVALMLEPGSKESGPFALEHPLQPFSPRYFDRSQPRFISRSLDAYRGATACQAQRSLARDKEAPVLPLRREPKPLSVALRDLETFFKNPSRYFLRSLGIVLDDEITILADREPVSLSALERYGVGEKILEGLLAAQPFDTKREELRGLFPSGVAGRELSGALERECAGIFRELRELIGDHPAVSREIGLVIDGTEIQGTIPHVFSDVHVLSSYGQANGGRLLATWIRHLCLCASGSSILSAFVGRKEGRPEVHEFDPLEAKVATERLSELVRLFLEGLNAPLRFDPVAALAVAVRSRGARLPKEPSEREATLRLAARNALFPSFGGPRSRELDPSISLLLGSDDPLLLDVGATQGDRSFLEISELVFGPLLDARRVRLGEEEPG